MRSCDSSSYRLTDKLGSFSYRNGSSVIVLSAFAAMSAALNHHFVDTFDIRYRALIEAFHGNGEDLVLADFTRRAGGLMTALLGLRPATSGRRLEYSSYSGKPAHYAELSVICGCLARNVIGDGLKACATSNMARPVIRECLSRAQSQSSEDKLLASRRCGAVVQWPWSWMMNVSSHTNQVTPLHKKPPK